MLFNTFEFFVFFSAVIFLYFNVSRERRWLLLLIASYIFYMGWRPSYIILLLAVTINDYVAGRIIDASGRRSTRVTALTTALTINFSILAFYKYLDFLVTNVLGLVGLFSEDVPSFAISIVLPVGISFFIFQSSSYTIDVFRNKHPIERHFGKYALYVSFFPQLVAGPIERAPNLLRQINTERQVNASDIVAGLRLVGMGLFKKMCIADLLAPFVAGIYASPQDFNGSYLWIATFLFAIQIYCDFSGYSDIARGVARMLGFDLVLNFRQPYFSRSIREFWQRWHISLSAWFRDYVYVSLGGSQVATPIWVRNILVVFLLSGLWHGAAWTFVVWGGLHGVAVVVETMLGKAWNVVANEPFVQTAPVRFLIAVVAHAWVVSVVLIAWVFFRANSLSDALTILKGLLQLGPVEYGTFKLLGLPSFELLLAAVNIALLLMVDFLVCYRRDWLESAADRFRYLPPLGGAIVAQYILLFGVFDQLDFIYFQF